MARSTFYYHRKKAEKQENNNALEQQIRLIYDENKGRYGYRRITRELRSRGYLVNHKKVLRIMRLSGIKCMVRLRKYRSYKGAEGKIAPNLLNRQFYTDKPNTKWVTDVTEFTLSGKKLYLSPILDLFNGEIISYNLSERSTYYQITDMLAKAFSQIPDDTNLILHSDQGWHYRLPKYHLQLKQKGIRQSMSRKGNCYDNAVIENFFGQLKSELFYLRKFESIEQLKTELNEYIDYYNNKRIKLKLAGLSPVQYRIQSTA